MHTKRSSGMTKRVGGAVGPFRTLFRKRFAEQSLRLVRQGGLVLLDNVLWYGKVADGAVDDKQTVALRALNDQLVQDARVDFSLLPIGDGLALCRKR